MLSKQSEESKNIKFLNFKVLPLSFGPFAFAFGPFAVFLQTLEVHYIETITCLLVLCRSIKYPYLSQEGVSSETPFHLPLSGNTNNDPPPASPSPPGIYSPFCGGGGRTTHSSAKLGSVMCSSRKYPHPPKGWWMDNLRWRGSQ